MSGSLAVAKVYYTVHLLLTASLPFCEPRHLDLTVAILLYLQLLLSIQQITHFPSINLKETHVKERS